MPRTHKPNENNHWSPIFPLLPRAVFSSLALWRHYIWSVKLRNRRVLVSLRHILRLFLQAQIDIKWYSVVISNRAYRFSATGIWDVMCKECSTFRFEAQQYPIIKLSEPVFSFNSSMPSTTYIHQQTRPSFYQKMTCPLLDTRVSSEGMLAYCWLDPLEQISRIHSINTPWT